MSPKYSKLAMALLALAMAAGLGACGRAQKVTSAAGRTSLDGAGTQVVAGCPTLLGNTLETAFEFNVESGAVVQFRPERIRIQTDGDAAEVAIAAIGPCAASDVPSINFVRGHANVFLSGTNTSITTTGQPLEFGALLFPGAGIEDGVVVADDAEGNVLEIIWPGMAGLPPGPPVLRLQMRQFDTWVREGRSIDAVMRFDAVGADGATATYDVRADGLLLPAQRR